MRFWENGFVLGLLGVMIFSGSLPATRIAVGAFDPVFLTLVRATIAGLLGVGLLLGLGASRPLRKDYLNLAIVAVGVVVGFPLLTALALQHINSARSIVFIGLLPLSTAIFGVVLGGEKPQPAFWLFSILGSVLVAGFALSQGGSGSWYGDLLMVAAIIVCGLGYAQGAKLSRRLGGWQVISWSLVISLPVMAPLAVWTMPTSVAHVQLDEWTALAYVSVFSMLIGFVFWYRGLALGGVTAISQLQLLQPFMGLMLAATIMQEQVHWQMIAVSVLVVACVAGARRFSGKSV
ncbi:DMT family transporter [Maritalea porphyrae]|uniref:DMT family transporter n=1 Tax=Maritalea porphyrae TaxID=880732 RepID=UPI0022B06106|nr:DMT family transporter [Maritalea porphyrae]MCZ4273613.1 DMT family transporter [Maritalea porphyrae]